MPIRTISKNGVPTAYQAIVGNGGKGNSKSFSIAKLGNAEAFEAATAEAARMEASYVPKERFAHGANVGGVAGLRLEYMPSRDPSGTPILYVVATWNKNGKEHTRRCSTDIHGILPAIAAMKLARERGAGVAIPQSASELEVLMRKALDFSKKS